MTAPDDGTMADYWRDVRPSMQAESQQRRADNREHSARILREAGIAFQSKNDGAHLIVTHRGHTYDFWPGTGLWCMRGSTQRHRGVRGLLKQIGRQMQSAEGAREGS